MLEEFVELRNVGRLRRVSKESEEMLPERGDGDVLRVERAIDLRLAMVEDGEREMLEADVLVLVVLRDGDGLLERLLELAREHRRKILRLRGVRTVRRHRGRRTKRPFIEHAEDEFDRHAVFSQNAPDEAPFLNEDAIQEVVVVHLGVFHVVRDVHGLLKRVSRTLRESVVERLRNGGEWSGHGALIEKNGGKTANVEEGGEGGVKWRGEWRDNRRKGIGAHTISENVELEKSAQCSRTILKKG